MLQAFVDDFPKYILESLCVCFVDANTASFIGFLEERPTVAGSVWCFKFMAPLLWFASPVYTPSTGDTVSTDSCCVMTGVPGVSAQLSEAVVMRNITTMTVRTAMLYTR